MKALSGLCLTGALLSGCGWLSGLGVASGVVTGVVTYAGAPAPGKRVFLAGADLRVVTDENGRYTFQNVGNKRVQVQYFSQSDRPGVLPNEVASWRSAILDLTDGSGREVPSFEVAYNGLLYPERQVALLVSDKDLVPFHFSVHPQAQKYRVKLTTEAGENIWTSDWSGDPTAVFGKVVTAGRYRWSVEIDAGDRGLGVTRDRGVDF